MVEREDFAFKVDIEYERLPSFCSACKSIGHSLGECRHNSSKQSNKDNVKKKVTT